MPVALEEIHDIQFITNKSGEKTAVIIPHEDKDKDFRKLLTEYIEAGNYKGIKELISLEETVQVLETLIQKIKNPTILKEIMSEIESLLERIDEKIEDDFDLEVIAERADEETISHDNLVKELKANGLL